MTTSAWPMRTGTAAATSGSAASRRAVSAGWASRSRDCGRPSDAITRTSKPKASSNSRTDTSSPRDSSTMSNISAPAAAMPRMPRALRARPPRHRPPGEGQRPHRRTSVSVSLRTSTHEASALAAIPSGRAMASACQAIAGVMRTNTSAVS